MRWTQNISVYFIRYPVLNAGFLTHGENFSSHTSLERLRLFVAIYELSNRVALTPLINGKQLSCITHSFPAWRDCISHAGDTPFALLLGANKEILGCLVLTVTCRRTVHQRIAQTGNRETKEISANGLIFQI